MAGSSAPGMGSTGAAKESLGWIAIPGSGLCFVGLLVTLYATLFPGTLAHQYLVQTGAPEYAHRNLTALLQVMAKQESSILRKQPQESSGTDMITPRADDLVVHLRLGDVLTSSCCTNVNRPILRFQDTKQCL